MKIKVTEIENIIESLDTQLIEETPSKHDCHWETFVTKIENKFYRFSIECSYNNGRQFYDDTIDLEEVIPIEKTVTVWKKA